MTPKLSLILILIILTGLNPLWAERIELSGNWDYRLTGAPSSIPGEGEILLPATLDEAHKSVWQPASDNTTQLRHEFSFIGEAAYSREIDIPKNWEGKDIELFIERSKPSRVFIDGKEAGVNSRISSPQRYDLTSLLSPGKHRIEIFVNNADSIPPIVARSSHAVSESTQTNWNGILGRFYLQSRNPFHVTDLTIDDRKLPEDILVNVGFSQQAPAGLSIALKLNGVVLEKKDIKTGTQSMSFSIPLEEKDLWSALNPRFHYLSVEITKRQGGEIFDEYDIKTGFRKLSTKDGYFYVNDNPIFLRGTVNAAVFPLTTYPPLDKESWIEYFNIIKDYGLNHVRFHSWTPPEVAFEAADETGVYILTELPIWGELDRDLKFHNRFLKEELKGIMEAYSSHPSFLLFSPGNELWGDISLMKEYKEMAKSLNPRILATYGSNLYLGMNGEIGGEDFLLSAKTGDDIDKSLRGSVSFADSPTGGHLNSTLPESTFNFSESIKGISVPVISHEVGQYQSYPDFEEIDKYTGILKPDNLVEFRKRAQEAGTLRKQKDFTEASGKWVTKLYKTEMEMAARTPGMAGYELFGIQDYPGQGTAYVGILNPFMQSKGFISPEEWKQSSDDILLLAEFPKFSFVEEEEVNIPVKLANFTTNPDTVSSIRWSIGFASGELPVKPVEGLMNIGSISFKTPGIPLPRKMTLSLTANDGHIANNYDFWVFPSNPPKNNKVIVTDNLTEAIILLDQGEKVILCPDTAVVAKASLEPLFTTDFWNYRMYRSICEEMNLTPSPGTLGLFINDNHPALRNFPTDNHTDFQWYPIISNSRPLIIDRLPKDFDPVVEVIDNVERNFRLSLILECNVEKGRLIILSADLKKLEQSPEGRWLLYSLKEYISGKEWKPQVTLSPQQLVNLVTKPSNSRLIKELKNETYNSKWD